MIILQKDSKQPKELLLRLVVARLVNTLHAVNIGSLVVSTKLWGRSWNALGWTRASSSPRPIKTGAETKDTYTLFPFVSAVSVLLVGIEPLLLSCSLYITIVPRSSSLHVYNRGEKMVRIIYIQTSHSLFAINLQGISSTLSSPFLTRS